MFRAFGIDEVAVLDGGFPAWKKSGLKVEDFIDQDNSSLEKETCQGVSSAEQHLLSREAVVSLISKDNANGSSNLIDARSNDRFTGKAREPRAGLRSGHMPTSVKVPFSSLLVKNEGMTSFASVEIQKQVFLDAGVNLKAKDFFFTCGSGVTACVPLLCLVEHFDVSFDNCKVYDGSFAEWGKPELNLPIEKS